MKKLVHLFIVLGAIVFSSCEEETEETPNVSENQSAKIDDSMGMMSEDIVSLTQTEGVIAIQDLVDLLSDLDDFSRQEEQSSWVKSKLMIIDEVFAQGVASNIADDDLISFDDIIGVWEWNSDLQDFIKSAEQTEAFIIKFPTAGSSSNNGIFTLSNLELEVFQDEYGMYQLPTEIKANLVVSNQEVMNLTAIASYTEEDGEILPLTASINLSLVPFEFILNFDDSQPTSSTIDASLTKNNELLLGIDLAIEFTNRLKVIPDIFSGSVAYRDVSIAGIIDLGEIDNDGDPNDFIDLEVLLEGQKVGDIIFVLEEDEDGYEDYIPYIVYSDGTQEALEDLLEPILEEIEDALDDFED